jgi:hypothetical protein
MKSCSALISCPLAHIRNHALYTGTFPEYLKMSLVTPLYKIGDKTSMINYKPISLLTTFYKVLEKVMHNRLSQNVHCNNILVPE